MTKEAGFVNTETDVTKKSATFKVAAGFDYKAALNEIAEGGNKHVKDWAIDE